MPLENVIYDGLQHPLSAISYHVSQTLDRLYPEKALLETDDSQFNLQTYAADRQCQATAKPSLYHQILANWGGPEVGLEMRIANGGFDVLWQGHRIEVLVMSWKVESCPEIHSWILADSREVAEQFFLTVCEWNATVRGEVLVFEEGYWEKSPELYQSIRGVTFDTLILRGSLKQEILEDVRQFLASRATYERYRVPWKRGILFVGPPGNGKTHAVKALLNSIGLPCLYVKSFRSRWGTDHGNIRAVFQRARQATPCVLVLEDLDSLVDGTNRSFFLNEVDGFAANAGILTIATTNHPERLDPAILDRPSRFDRKYHFELPAPTERLAYVTLWHDTLEPELRPSEATAAQVVARTEGFSFAYLKELFLSSMMHWVGSAHPGGMDASILAQVDALREQMSTASEEAAGKPAAGRGEVDDA
jgi:ATPase family associated with various cellular activities (AAA)